MTLKFLRQAKENPRMDQSEIDKEMETNELYEKPDLPVSSSFEENDDEEQEQEDSTLDEEQEQEDSTLDEEQEQEDSTLDDDDNTVEQEHISTAHQPKETHFGDLIRSVIGFGLFCFGIFCFVRFLDIRVESSDSTFSRFLTNCCGNYFNSTRCSIKDKCFLKFFQWLRSLNISAHSSWQLKNCCYWHTPYMDWRINALPFCDLKCLQST